VALGLEQHLLDEAPVAVLGVAAAGDLGARVAQPQAQAVADPLEVAERQEPRATGPGRARDRGERDGGDVDARQQRVGEVALEAGDLTAQRPSGRAFVDIDERRPRQRRGGRLSRVFQQLHSSLLGKREFYHWLRNRTTASGALSPRRSRRRT
jgi:hypothetical protein